MNQVDNLQVMFETVNLCKSLCETISTNNNTKRLTVMLVVLLFGCI